jgi:hypothetical protein
MGAALAAGGRGRSQCVAVSAIEHKAVLSAAHTVAGLGGEQIVLPVDASGALDLAALNEALSRRPALVSVMWVNNEVGTIQPMAEIASRCAAAGVPLHSDGVQAFGKVAVDLRQLPIALFTLSGHKLGAPKGIGALIVRERGMVESIIRREIGTRDFVLRVRILRNVAYELVDDRGVDHRDLCLYGNPRDIGKVLLRRRRDRSGGLPAVDDLEVMKGRDR